MWGPWLYRAHTLERPLKIPLCVHVYACVCVRACAHVRHPIVHTAFVSIAMLQCVNTFPILCSIGAVVILWVCKEIIPCTYSHNTGLTAPITVSSSRPLACLCWSDLCRLSHGYQIDVSPKMTSQINVLCAVPNLASQISAPYSSERKDEPYMGHFRQQM